MTAESTDLIIDGEFTSEDMPHIDPEFMPFEEGYYETKEEVKLSGSKTVPVGGLFYFHNIGVGNEADFIYGSIQGSFKMDVFRRVFRYAPDGQFRRQQLMGKLIDDIGTMSKKADVTTQGIKQFMPSVGAAGQLEGVEDDAMDDEEDEAGEVSTEISVTSANLPAPVAMKRSLARMQHNVTAFQGKMQSKVSEIEFYTQEQSLILKAKMGGLTKLVKKAQEAIWTINLYLGQDEEIWPLAEGAFAGAEEPITIRQSVLYMDEECAVAADEGGIDAASIEEFDAWLLEKPEHLDQIFPEKKGVICLKPRRSEKNYNDAWQNEAMRAANKETYFLLRNGENLYRMWTEFEIGDTLMPRQYEFAEFFKKRGILNMDECVALPGTREYMRAEEAADAQSRHYYRVGLILQGLIDRTMIFHPMVGGTINICDPNTYAGRVRLISDSEMTLSDGRERFDAWFSRINGELEPGCRIIGDFRWGMSSGEERQARLSPEKAALPDSNTIHVIEGRHGRGFSFLYKRQAKNRWGDITGDTLKTRARCTVYPSDSFILNIDAATIEDMEFFLRNRLDRPNYMHLFPILKQAIKIKKQEVLDEAPFRLLLIGQIMQAHAADHADAESMVDELIRWFKFKNRTHRALDTSDANAVAIIVQEYGLRIKARTSRKAERMQEVATAILSVHPDALLIAHKTGNEYVALIPSEFTRDVFVTEQAWKRGALTESREWRTVDNRWMRWEILHTSDRWHNWKIGASVADYLTGPEKQEIADGAADMRIDASAGWIRGEDEQSRQVVKPLSVTENGGKVCIYWMYQTATVYSDNLLERRLEPPKLRFQEIDWKRGQFKRDRRCTLLYDITTKGGTKFKSGEEAWIIDSNRGGYTLKTDDDRRVSHVGKDEVRIHPEESRQMDYRMGSYHEFEFNNDLLPWEDGYKTRYGNVDFNVQRVYHVYPDNVAFLRSEYVRYEGVRAVQGGLSRIYSAACRSIEKQVVQCQQTLVYQKFIQEYGQPELWEGHKKTLKDWPTSWDSKYFRAVITTLVQAGIPVAGESVRNLIARHEAQPYKAKAKEREWSYHEPKEAEPEVFDDYILDLIVEVSDEE